MAMDDSECMADTRDIEHRIPPRKGEIPPVIAEMYAWIEASGRWEVCTWDWLRKLGEHVESLESRICELENQRQEEGATSQRMMMRADPPPKPPAPWLS